MPSSLSLHEILCDVRRESLMARWPNCKAGSGYLPTEVPYGKLSKSFLRSADGERKFNRQALRRSISGGLKRYPDLCALGQNMVQSEGLGFRGSI